MAINSLDTLAEQVRRENAALLVIDMQNDYCHGQGVLGKQGRDLRTSQEMSLHLENFINTCRKIKFPIIFVKTIHYPYTDSPSWLRRLAIEGRESVCRPETWGAEFYGGIRPGANEIVVTKHRFSAFIWTNLDLILRSNGIRSLLITGAATHLCVESTVRDGYMLNYYIVMLEDLVADSDPELHRVSLKNVARHFGTVTTSAEVERLWRDFPTVR
jgi:ureidoacrylate peracid hydrolase